MTEEKLKVRPNSELNSIWLRVYREYHQAAVSVEEHRGSTITGLFAGKPQDRRSLCGVGNTVNQQFS